MEFPKGEYHIYKAKAQLREYHTSNTNSIEHPEKTIGILVEGHENLTIDGNGSLFMMHGNMMAFAVVKSENILLQDFSWDFAVPTVSEMTIVGMGTESGQQYTDFYIPACFPYEITGNTIKWYSEKSPYTGEYYWTETGIHNSYAVVGYSPEEEMTRNYWTSQGPFQNVSNIKQLENGVVRITYNSARPDMQTMGMVFELNSNAVRETAGAFTWESTNVRAERVNVHFMHGFGWLIQMSTDVAYVDCNFMPRENSGHRTVSYADIIHASGAAGEILIENCNFSNSHDDPINLHGTFTRVEQRVDAHTLQLKYIHRQQGGFPQYHVGDAESEQNIQIRANNAYVAGNTLEVTELKNGSNHVYVVVTAKDGITRNIYYVEVLKPYAENVDVFHMQLNGKEISGDFDAEGNLVTGITENQAIVEITTKDSGATIEAVSGIQKKAATGTLSATFDIYKQTPEITITITARDGVTKQTFRIRLEKVVYLSDLGWRSDSTVGYGSINKDASSSGAAIRLADENGNPVTFEKGIGTHADSIIYFELGDHSFTRLQGYAGVDYVQYNADYGSVQFQIEADGTKVFDSEVMEQKTPMKVFDIDISRTSLLVLKALKGEHDWNDHADWAEMKLIGEFPEIEGYVEVESIHISKTELALNEGESTVLTATVMPQNATNQQVTWTSSNPEVATVSEVGKVTAVAAGTATITAKAKEKTAVCVVTVEKTEVKPCGHEFDEGTISKVANCTEAGERRKTCKVCGETKTEVIAASGHKMGTASVTTEATCTTAGVNTSKCTNVGCTHSTTEVIKASGHKMGTASVTTEATCTIAGVNTSKCTNAGCTHSTTEVIKATGHKFDTGKITKKATATKKGMKKYTCTVCKDSKTEEIPALDAPKKGSTFVVKGATYKITKAGLKNGTVTFVKTKSTAKTISVPKTVTSEGIKYNVTAIEKNAFKNNKKVNFIVVGKNVSKIGATAFMNCTKLKKITFQTTKLVKKNLTKTTFKGVKTSVRIAVPKNKVKTYKNLFKNAGLNKKVKITK